MGIPYDPLYTPDVSPERIRASYKQSDAEYGAGNAAVGSCSSGGGNPALGRIFTINLWGEGIPLPEKRYISSPGTCLYTGEEKAKAQKPDNADIAAAAQLFGTICEILTHGRELKDYTAHARLGFCQDLTVCCLPIRRLPAPRVAV